MNVYDENTLEYWEGKRTMNVEDKLAKQITEEVLPGLRTLFTNLLGLQQFWIVNEMEDKIQEAIDNNTLLAGYPPSAWYSWGEALRVMMVWINTPQESLMGKTPLQVFLKEYTKQ